MGLARENLTRAQKKQKVWYDRTARACAYATGDQVMVLIPVRKNKLQAAWEGSFKVVKQLNEVNYVVELSKKDGSLRFCVDYRKLNAITVSDAYPMPRPDELRDKLGGARYLTTMGLTKGYWQVPLDADEIGLYHPSGAL
ncbi:unnamed protein product [Eretmochelys imbricata]